jgi:hypothetical protein
VYDAVVQARLVMAGRAFFRCLLEHLHIHYYLIKPVGKGRIECIEIGLDILEADEEGTPELLYLVEHDNVIHFFRGVLYIQ